MNQIRIEIDGKLKINSGRRRLYPVVSPTLITSPTNVSFAILSLHQFAMSRNSTNQQAISIYKKHDSARLIQLGENNPDNAGDAV